MPPGTYYLLLAIDDIDWIPESNEENNLYIGPTITIAEVSADLKPTEVKSSTNTGRWGEPSTVNWTVTNNGEDDIPADSRWFDKIYLSSNRILDRSDRSLSDREQEGPPRAGGSYTGTLEITLPAVADGTYYLLVNTDIGWVQTGDYTEGQNNLPELDEANNVLVGPAIAVPAVIDLAMKTPTVDTEVTRWGESITVTWNASNDVTDPLRRGLT